LTDLITVEAFGELFHTFRHTAFRLEPRERYNSPVELEPLRRFLAGEPDDLAWNRPWLDLIKRLTAEGKVVSRVRVVSRPFSDYTRFGLFCSEHTNQAGEEIRYLHRAQADGLPDFDYWLFDSERVAKLHFAEDDAVLGAEIITDPGEVVRLSAARDDAWHRAVSREAFLSADTTDAA
jgi:hypothetical protein